MPDNEPVSPPAVEATTPESTNTDQSVDSDYELAHLMHALYDRGVIGANWFFWVAALSLVNTVILHAGGIVYFIVGLGITLITDNIAKVIVEERPNLHTILTIAAISFAIVVSVVVAGFGWLSRKRYDVVYLIGMVLYLLDGLLFVLFQDWLCVAFHVYALYSMWGGWRAFRQLNAIEQQLRRQPTVPNSSP